MKAGQPKRFRFVSGHRFSEAALLVLKGRGFSRAVGSQNQWRLQPLNAA
jgi:hypothetical protein